VPLLLLAAACTSTDASAAPPADSIPEEPIRLSMSLYIVDDADSGSTSPLSSERSVADVDKIAQRMQEIWEQAGIELAIATVSHIEAPRDTLVDLGNGDTSSFLAAARSGAMAIPNVATINGFYAASIGTANGMTPSGTHLFFVTDAPSVPDERVSSHEIGHILGLHHVLEDPDRLMFSGTEGITLTDWETAVARYAALGILDGVR